MFGMENTLLGRFATFPCRKHWSKTSTFMLTQQWLASIVFSILHIVNHRLHSCSILETRNAGGSSKSRSFAAAMKNTFGLLYVRVCVNQRILSAERRGCYTLTVATQVVRWRMVQARISNPSICRHLGLSSYHVIKLSICLVAANNVMESE